MKVYLVDEQTIEDNLKVVEDLIEQNRRFDQSTDLWRGYKYALEDIRNGALSPLGTESRGQG